jgi:hypothetical protein
MSLSMDDIVVLFQVRETEREKKKKTQAFGILWNFAAKTAKFVWKVKAFMLKG